MLRLSKQHTVDTCNRFPTIITCITVAFLVITLRLWYLQILKGNQYKKFSEKNRVTRLWVPAHRGMVYDRNGTIIVDNRPSFDLSLTRAYVNDLAETMAYLNKFLSMDFSDNMISREIAKIRQWPRYKSYPLFQDLSREGLARIKTHSQDPKLDGINIEIHALRDYTYGPIGAHILGYLGEINEQQIKSLNQSTPNPYRMGNYIGKYGIEKKYESYLRGIDGVRPVEIDARGRIRNSDPIGDLFSKDLERKPIPGFNIQLTIDMDLEKVAYDTFKAGESGAIVAMDPRTGEIIAMVSVPAFDPRVFSKRIPQSLWTSLNKDPLKPLEDKALRGTYAPGSTYKIIVAIAGLEEGVIDTHTTVTCTGHMTFGGRQYACWRKGGHGTVNIYDAIAQSCNIFFYKLGQRLGVDRIAKYAALFRLGQPTGIGINNEKSGLVPTQHWKQTTRNTPWYDGETLSTAIGQGYNLVTPIQLAQMISIVAMRGQYHQPYIVKRIFSVNNETVPRSDDKATDSTPHSLNISDSTWDIIHTALSNVVNHPKGSAYWYARSKKFTLAGKTGTAQVVALPKDDDAKVSRRFRDHAIFVAFAPVNDPIIAVSVVVEHGGGGSSTASPKAKTIIEYYLENHLKNKEQSTARRDGTPLNWMATYF